MDPLFSSVLEEWRTSKGKEKGDASGSLAGAFFSFHVTLRATQDMRTVGSTASPTARLLLLTQPRLVSSHACALKAESRVLLRVD